MDKLEQLMDMIDEEKFDDLTTDDYIVLFNHLTNDEKITVYHSDEYNSIYYSMTDLISFESEETYNFIKEYTDLMKKYSYFTINETTGKYEWYTKREAITEMKSFVRNDIHLYEDEILQYY